MGHIAVVCLYVGGWMLPEKTLQERVAEIILLVQKIPVNFAVSSADYAGIKPGNIGSSASPWGQHSNLWAASIEISFQSHKRIRYKKWIIILEGVVCVYAFPMPKLLVLRPACWVDRYFLGLILQAKLNPVRLLLLLF